MTRSREAANWIGTGVTSAELDKLDGFTGTVDDLNYAKDLRATGVTATEFDHLDITSGTPGSGNFLRGDKTWTAITMPTTGISNGNTLVANANVADDDFLRVDGTSIEGRTAAETLSDIGGQASLTNGISNTNNVVINSASVADDEYARFTSSGLESRSTAEVLSDIGAAPLASPTFSGTTNVSSGVTLPSNPTIVLGSNSTFPDGHILQSGYAELKDGQATTTDYEVGWADVTNLSVALTPSAATNYILAYAHIQGSNATASYAVAIRLWISGGASSNRIGIGNTDGNRIPVGAGGPTGGASHGLDTISTVARVRCNDSVPNWSSGALTVKVQFATNNTSHTARINRAGSNANDANYTTTCSTLTVFEIKG